MDGVQDTRETPDRARPKFGEPGSGHDPANWSPEQSRAEQALFNVAFTFAEVDQWTAHAVLGDSDGYPAVYLRIIFDNEEQRQRFLTARPDLVLHPPEVEL